MSGSSLEAAVAGVLQRHQYKVKIAYSRWFSRAFGILNLGVSDQVTYCECQEGRCDEMGWMLQMDIRDHPAHQAAAVIEALGVELGEDLWDAQQCVQDWRDSHDCDDTRENRKRLAALAKRLRDVANQLAAAGSRS